MQITLSNLSPEEINLILAGLSELPTKSNAWPVAMKVKAQADEQMAAQGAQDGDKVDSEGNQ